MVLANSVKLFRNGHEHITIMREPTPHNLFIDQSWTSHGSFNNPNDEQFFGNIGADIALTIYDTINKRNINHNTRIRHYDFAGLRPQMSCGRIPYAIEIINNFFQDNSLVACNFGDTSGGMTSHCIYRDMSHTYVAYISMHSGPYAIDIIDPDYINTIDPHYVRNSSIDPPYPYTINPDLIN